MAFSRVKIRAPEPVRPRAAAQLVPREVLAGLDASRRELLDLADRLGEERFSRLLFPHFILGRFDSLDWFRFVTRHEKRHLAQLERILAALRELLGEASFTHDFEHVEYDEPEFDEQMGMPGLHTVASRVQPNQRKTILPADLFSQHDRSFWDVPGQNPRRVTVL